MQLVLTINESSIGFDVSSAGNRFNCDQRDSSLRKWYVVLPDDFCRLFVRGGQMPNTPAIDHMYIWRPIFSEFFPRVLLSIGALLILLLVAILPPTPSGMIATHLYDLFLSIRGIEGDVRGSKQPLPTALSFGLALVLPPGIVALTCLSKIRTTPLYSLVEKRGVLSRVIVVIGLLVFMVVQFYNPIDMEHLGFSKMFFRAVAESRFVLGVWAVALFAVNFVFWLWIVFELTVLFNFLTHAPLSPEVRLEPRTWPRKRRKTPAGRPYGEVDRNRDGIAS